MAVTAANLKWIKPGSRRPGGFREYTATYQVEVSSKSDGPQIILAYFQATAGLPWINSPYAVGNDSDSQAYCDGILPAKAAEPGSEDLWYVDCHFKTPGDFEEGLTEAGVPTDDPLYFKVEIETSFHNVGRPVRKAIYRGGYTGGPLLGLTQGEPYPVRNSAAKVLDPPLERDVAMRSYKVSRYFSAYPTAADEYVNTVNEDDFTINRPEYGLVLPVRKYTARIVNIATVPRYVNLQQLWYVTYEVLILMGNEDSAGEPLYDWREEVPDIGVEASQMTGDKSIYTGSVIAHGDKPEYQLQSSRYTDEAGIPASEPILLDGAGKALFPIDADPIYIIWGLYAEKPFGILNL